MARVIALMALAALGLTQAPVHEPVHGRRQAISAAVTQRSGRDSSTTVAHLTIWLRDIRNQVHEVRTCVSTPILDTLQLQITNPVPRVADLRLRRGCLSLAVAACQ